MTQIFRVAVGIALLSLFTFTRPLEADEPVPTTAHITILQKYFVVHNESNGPLAGPFHTAGVRLYLAHLVTTEKGNFGGISTVSSHLTNDNGAPVNPDGTGPTKLHAHDERLFEADIPNGKSVAFLIHMYKADQTTDDVKRVYEEGKVPDLGEKAINWEFKGTFSSEKGENNSLAETIKGIAKGLGQILFGLWNGKKLNTDDDYGYWTFELGNYNGLLTSKLVSWGPGGDKTILPNGTLPLDGQRRLFAAPYFEDKENAITVGLDIVATPPK